MKPIAALLLFSALTWAASSGVDIYTTKDIQDLSHKLASKGTAFASEDLAQYGNHRTMIAYREATGSAELHEHDSDIFVVENGEATIVTGGKIVHPTTQKPGEIRGASINGGERHTLSTGDIIHIPAGTPHQLLIEKGKPFTYFVVKVTGQ